MSREEREEGPIVSDRGPDDPVAAIIGGVHGDEPSGVRAVESILHEIDAGMLTLDRGGRFIIAHPGAIAANRRFIEVDMNRSFPGDPSGALEQRIAVAVCDAVANVPTLALHATRSSGTPFAFASPHDPVAIDLARALSVEHLVLADGADIGSLSACGTVVTIEAGPQGSDRATRLARALADEFLIATGVVEGEVHYHEPTVYEIGEEIDRPPGETYEVLVENFERVGTGQPFARVDETELTAGEPFHPILLSVDGYEDIFGFRGRKLADSPAELDTMTD